MVVTLHPPPITARQSRNRRKPLKARGSEEFQPINSQRAFTGFLAMTNTPALIGCGDVIRCVLPTGHYAGLQLDRAGDGTRKRLARVYVLWNAVGSRILSHF